MKIKIKYTHPDARKPEKAHPSDFCYDVYAVTEEEVAPNVWKYGLGFALQIIRGEEIISKTCIYKLDPCGNNHEYEEKELAINFGLKYIDVGITLRPRSSIWKTGMVLSNSIGTGDENFTGEYSAVFYHVLPNMPRYKVGDRVAQAHLDFTMPVEFVEVEELEATDRGCSSYGSSGK